MGLEDNINTEYGIECFYRKDYKKALSCFFAALSQNLEDSNNYYNIAITYEALGETELARVFYEQSLQLNPSNTRTLNNLAVMSKNTGDIQKYIQYLDKALETNPDDAEAYSQFGEYYRGKKDYITAENYYQKAAKLDPNFFYNYYNLAVLYLETNEKQKAKECLEKCLNIKKDFTPALDLIKHCQ